LKQSPAFHSETGAGGQAKMPLRYCVNFGAKRYRLTMGVLITGEPSEGT
jgi:hypothetical protein